MNMKWLFCFSKTAGASRLSGRETFQLAQWCCVILLTILILKCLPRFTWQTNITITLARPRCFASLISFTQFSAVVAGFRHFKMFDCYFCGNCFYSFSIRKTDNNRGFPSSPDLSALDQYRTSGSPSVRYLESRFLINRVITKNHVIISICRLPLRCPAFPTLSALTLFWQNDLDESVGRFRGYW